MYPQHQRTSLHYQHVSDRTNNLSNLAFHQEMIIIKDLNYYSIFVVPGVPLQCTNTTFRPRNASLIWAPPSISLQNGMIQGYNLNCSSGNGNRVSGTESTQTNSDTMFAIPILTPFTLYTCRLSSINEAGEGPYTTCHFTTAQDSKLAVYFIIYNNNY